jgi:hypothetical protein
MGPDRHGPEHSGRLVLEEGDPLGEGLAILGLLVADAGQVRDDGVEQGAR